MSRVQALRQFVKGHVGASFSEHAFRMATLRAKAWMRITFGGIDWRRYSPANLLLYYLDETKNIDQGGLLQYETKHDDKHKRKPAHQAREGRKHPSPSRQGASRKGTPHSKERRDGVEGLDHGVSQNVPARV